MYNLLYTLHSC